MKTFKLIFTVLLLGTLSTGSAWAARGHGYGGGHGRGGGHFGVYIGAPFIAAPFYGPWFSSPYYYPPYYPPTVVERSAPPVYIEQQAQPQIDQGTTAPSNFWYYCAPAKGYYPYVKECPGGWQKVAPQPSAQP